MTQLVKFRPFLKSTIWGGEEISSFKGIEIDCENLGESWELSGVPGCESVVAEGPDAGLTLTELVDKYKESLMGRRVYERYGNKFPLLIKFIDARDDLSLQVHPNDELAMKRHNSFGKTEMWYILSTKENARIHTGLTQEIDAEEYERRVKDHTLMDVVGSYESKPGDLFFLPAGRLHAIGTGNFLIEIQQSSDVTYRVDDYDRRDKNGNTRELHTELAKDAIDYKYYPDCKSTPEKVGPNTELLVKCGYFLVNKEDVDGEREIANGADSFMGIVCIEGSGSITAGGVKTEVKQGDTMLLPAEAKGFEVDGKMTLMTVVIPE